MAHSNPEIRIALRICLIICLIIGTLSSTGSIFIFFEYLKMHEQNRPLAQIIIAASLLVVAGFFYLSWFIRNKKISIYYYILIGGFVFLTYAIAAFSSLFQVGRPSMEFILLGVISCTGLWMLLAGLNPAIRKSFSNSENTPGGS